MWRRRGWDPLNRTASTTSGLGILLEPRGALARVGRASRRFAGELRFLWLGVADQRLFIAAEAPRPFDGQASQLARCSSATSFSRRGPSLSFSSSRS
jgi:hypothetical protein